MVKKMSVKEKAALVRKGNLVEPAVVADSALSPVPAVEVPVPMPFPSIGRKPTNSIALGLGIAGQGNQVIELQRQIEAFDGAFPTKKIDPNLILPSKYANRSEQSFKTKAFDELKVDIDSQGGNVQPIKVRPLKDGKFEIVFGHRRHRACLDLGIQVLATVEDLSEAELFCQMDRENRARKDLRPIEQGRMYAKALDNRLFPSSRKLAESIGVDLSNMGKALTLARLPSVVLDAFPSALDLQYRWGKVLDEMLKKDPDVLLSRAKEVKTVRPNASSGDVFQYLLEGGGTVLPLPSFPKKLHGKGGQTGTITVDPIKRAVTINLLNFDPERTAEIEKIIKSFIS